MSSRPVALDLCTAAGGAAVGYARAGFEVIGSDLIAQPRFPADLEFIQADALELLADTAWLRRRQVAVITASPPCFVHSRLRTRLPVGHGHQDLIPQVRALLRATGLPYVIENVEESPLLDPVTLCGSMFDLGAHCHDGVRRQLRRHRLFESNVALTAPGPCRHQGMTISCHGGGPTNHPTTAQGGYQGRMAERREAMGIDWMPRESLNLAIPPVYTEHLGRQLIAQLRP
jgi:DNA (cytosine-5)-methyltransferase 1